MTVNGLVASSFLDFLSFFAMILFPPFFCLPVWANAAYYARCGPRFPAKKYLCYVVGNSRDGQNRPDIEAVPRAVCVDLINLTMNYSTFWVSLPGSASEDGSRRLISMNSQCPAAKGLAQVLGR